MPWYVLWGNELGEPHADGPFQRGSDALYEAYELRQAEGWEVRAMLPEHLWLAVASSWDTWKDACMGGMV